MARAIRGQYDDTADEYSRITSLTFPKDDPESRSMTRQEFKAEADINTILNKFGIETFNQMQPGDIDYTLDLHGALAAAADIHEAHAKLPQQLREQFPTWQSMIAGAHTGELKKAMDKARDDAIAAQRRAELDRAFELDDARAARIRNARIKAAADKAALDLAHTTVEPPLTADPGT